MQLSLWWQLVSTYVWMCSSLSIYWNICLWWYFRMDMQQKQLHWLHKHLCIYVSVLFYGFLHIWMSRWPCILPYIHFSHFIVFGPFNLYVYPSPMVYTDFISPLTPCCFLSCYLPQFLVICSITNISIKWTWYYLVSGNVNSQWTHYISTLWVIHGVYCVIAVEKMCSLRWYVAVFTFLCLRL